jgi:hypothetical protein
MLLAYFYLQDTMTFEGTQQLVVDALLVVGSVVGEGLNQLTAGLNSWCAQLAAWLDWDDMIMQAVSSLQHGIGSSRQACLVTKG